MIQKINDEKIMISAYGFMYYDNEGVPREKIIGSLSDLNNPEKLKEFKQIKIPETLEEQRKDRLCF